MTQTQKIFQNALKEKLGNKLSQYLFLSICNILSLDFSLRKMQTNLDKHAASCANNISNYLLDKKVLSDHFNEVLTIFSIAITEPINPKNLAAKTQEQKVETQIIDNILSSCPNLCKLPEVDKQTIKNILTNLQKIDKDVNLSILLQNTNLLIGSLKDISVNKSQEKAEEEILQFLKLQKIYRNNTQTISKDMTRVI